MAKPTSADDLQAIPNVGPATAADLRRLGLTSPAMLKGCDAFELHARLCDLDGVRHDPCVIDVFMAAIHYVETGEARRWWEFTPLRKQRP
jgi:hypothetical protein